MSKTKVNLSANSSQQKTSQHATNTVTTSSHKKPGRLKGDVTLTLHTAYAQKLFLGFRTDKRTINLLQFAGRMAELWDAAAQDDPFADWYLLKVYDVLIKRQQQLATAIDTYQATLAAANQRVNLTITPFASQQPALETLWFRTPYGYLATRLVAQFDVLMRIIHTLVRIGIVLDKPAADIRQAWLDPILALFRLPFKWQAFAITRADVMTNTDAAIAAQAKMGALPEPILSGTLRAPFAPSIQHVANPSKTVSVPNTS